MELYLVTPRVITRVFKKISLKNPLRRNPYRIRGVRKGFGGGPSLANGGQAFTCFLNSFARRSPPVPATLKCWRHAAKKLPTGAAPVPDGPNPSQIEIHFSDTAFLLVENMSAL
jgi:hypothetical protein